jgi:two-component system, OmpR family, sensor histidine kinase BaeS
LPSDNKGQCGLGKPSWWPENEPWPPRRDQAHQWSRARRARFFRRLVILGFALLVLGVCGVVAIVWFVLTKLGTVTAAWGAPALVLLAFFSGIAAIVVLVGMMRRVGIPIRGVMEGAEQVAEGNYSIRVEERGPPPIRALAQAFNTMTERLASHDRVRRDLMADIAHELRTPLAVIQGKLEGLLDGVYQRDDAQVSELLAEVRVLGRLIEDLRTLALSESGALKLEKESTDITALAKDVVRAFEGEARTRNVHLQVENAPDISPIFIDAVRIREILVNLITNALDHTPAGGTIAIHLAESTEERIAIEVSDNGTGMTVEDTNRAFERFHKGTGSRGLGLGLAIARNLVFAHGGEIRLMSEPGRGTQIRFTLPRDARN